MNLTYFWLIYTYSAISVLSTNQELFWFSLFSLYVIYPKGVHCQSNRSGRLTILSWTLYFLALLTALQETCPLLIISTSSTIHWTINSSESSTLWSHIHNKQCSFICPFTEIIHLNCNHESHYIYTFCYRGMANMNSCAPLRGHHFLNFVLLDWVNFGNAFTAANHMNRYCVMSRVRHG